MKGLVAALSLLLAAFGSPYAAAQSQASCTTTVIKLHTERYLTDPAAINKSGTVVGSFQDLKAFVHGFIWSNESSQFYDYPGATTTQLEGINESGVISGTYTDGQGATYGFILHKDGTTTQFSVPGAFTTIANGINNHNVIVGYSATFNSNIYTGYKRVGDKFQTIEFPDAESTFPVAINDSGIIAGFYSDGSTHHGFTELNGAYKTLDVPGAYYSEIHAVNNKSEVVGAFRLTVDTKEKAFTYGDHKFTRYRYPSSIFTEFNGVNDLGDRVGDAVTHRDQGLLAGPGFVLTCR